MPHLNCVIKLSHFLNKRFAGLKYHFLTGLFDRIKQITVLNNWLLDSWKQILDDILKEWEIVFEKLGDIYVSKGSQKKLLFIHVGGSAFEETSSIDDTTHCPHTIIVMVLGRQLFRGKLESSYHLLCQATAFGEPEGVQHDLADHCIVGHHHCHCSEQGFQIVGQLSSTSIAWVHGDENTESGQKFNCAALEFYYWGAFGLFSE